MRSYIYGTSIGRSPTKLSAMNWRDGAKSPVWSGCLAFSTTEKSSVSRLGEGWSWFTTGLRKRYALITNWGQYTHTQTEQFQRVIEYQCLAIQLAHGIYGLWWEQVEARTVQPHWRNQDLSSGEERYELLALSLRYRDWRWTLIYLWSKNWNDTQEGKGVIPQCVQFTVKGEKIVIFGLESGTMWAWQFL